MQKIYKVIISLILAALPVNVLPFKLFAEFQTYYSNTVSDPIYLYNRLNNSYKAYIWAENTDVRIVFFEYTDYIVPYACSTSNSNHFYTAYKNYVPNANSDGSQKTLSQSYTVNGVTYYMNSGSDRQIDPNPSSYEWNTNINTITFNSSSPSSWSNDLKENIIYYTFGEGAVGPSVLPSFGELKIGFKTDIAYSGGNQDAWRLNKDTIYFDRYDSLGNDLFGYNIELQAVPFSVYDSSQSNVISKTVNDYLYDTVHVGSLGYWSPGQDYIDFTWEYITSRFSPVWWSTYGDNWSFTGWALENQWYRVGWSYRARLVDDEYNTLIDWQWIYNGTSIDGPDVNNIVNNNGLTPELVNSINNINNYNNTTNNNTYNNQTINYYSTDQESDGSWIEALLESILGTIADLVGKILDFFKSILDGLLDLILGLFGDVNPADSFFNWFSDFFNGISDIDLTLPQFNLPNEDLTSFNRLVQETLNIFSSNNIAFLIFIPLIILIIRAVF